MAFEGVEVNLKAAQDRLEAVEAHPPTALTPAPLYKAPSNFDGKREEFNTWLSQMLNYISLQPHLFPQGDRSKVLFTCGRMTGDAYTHIQAIAESSHTGVPAPELQNFSTFLAKLKRIFGPIDEQGEAERKIRQLTQGTRTVEEYAAQFNLIAAKTGWTTRPLVSQFYDGLAYKIKEKLVGMQPREMDYEGLVRRAAEMDAELRSLRSGSTHRGGQAALAADPNTMDLGPMRTSGGRQDQLSQEERERRRAAGLYYKCGKGRHQVRECRSAFNPHATPAPSRPRLAVATAGNASTPPSESWTPLPRSETLQPDTLDLLAQVLEIVRKGKTKEEAPPVAGSSKEAECPGF